MILVVTIAGLSYQTSLNLPASPDILVLMSHLGDLLLHNCPHSSFLTYKANNKVTAQSFCQRKRRRTIQNQGEWAKILTSNIPTHSQTTQYLADFWPHQRGVCRQNISGNSRQAADVLQEQQQCRQENKTGTATLQPTMDHPPWPQKQNWQHRTELYWKTWNKIKRAGRQEREKNYEIFKRDREKWGKRVLNAECWTDGKKVKIAEENRMKKLVSEEFFKKQMKNKRRDY